MDDEVNYGDAAKYVNDESVEMAWAIQAAERANIHMNLLMACDTSKLRLNKYQDSIYAAFRKDFPDLDLSKITHDIIKEPAAKEKWRGYCEQFKEIVEDYALGTLFRVEANKSYKPDNTIVVPKMSSVGLGGSGGTTTGLNPGGTANTTGTAKPETENIREGEVPAPIMELLKTVQAKVKENKDKSDEFQKQSNEGVKMVKFRLKEVNHMIADGVSAVAARDRQTAVLSNKVTKDYRLGKEAEAVQESISRNNTHTVAQQHAIQHIVEMIKEYEQQIIDYQEVVEQMTIRMRDLMQGQGQFTTAELKEYLTRFDAIFSSVANNLFEANSKVEELRGQLNMDEQQRVKEQRPVQQNWAQFKGPAAFPSHAVLTQLGAMLKPTQAALPGTTTGTGLFGSTAPTGGSLFGSSSTAAKPLFGSSTTTTGGNLFPSLTATSTAAPAASGSLFPSLATSSPKPATQFGSTLSTNTSGLLFSSKK